MSKIKNERILDGEKVAMLIRSKGATFPEASRQIGMSDSWLTGNLNRNGGRTRPVYVKALADYLGVDADEICRPEEDPPEVAQETQEAPETSETLKRIEAKLDALLRELGVRIEEENDETE